jgi:phage-related minor tail protein
MKFGKLAEQVLNSIAREILKVLILKPLMGAITSGISGIFGGMFGGGAGGGTLLGDSWTIGHTGGHVTAAGIIPRYHIGGLAKDEVPAILQTGEYVVSRKGVAALEKLNRGEVAGSGDTTVNIVVNNKTGLPFNLKQTGQQVDERTKFKTLYLELIHSDPDFKRMR